MAWYDTKETGRLLPAVAANRKVTSAEWNALTAYVRNPVVSTVTSATRPAANATTAGTFVRVRDPGTSETLEMCLQNSDGSYSWAVVAIAPV
jgi:hypothetical protein